jgi:ubiquinone/menaquinone biosynthesis C-methylase UbiE
MGINSLKSVSEKRWEVAQNSEKDFWEGFTTDSLKKDCNNFYSVRAYKFQGLWKRYIVLNDKTKILQIGCGPLDVINYVGGGKKFAVDPLADYYKGKFKLDYSKVKFIKGVGESLPFKDEEFDIVLLLNVLDHVQSAEKVLLECKRVLKKDGIFHFENNVYTKRFFLLANIWDSIQKNLFHRVFNVNHPYMFKKKDMRKFISQYFKICYEYTGERIGETTLEEQRKKVPVKRKFRRAILSWLVGGLEKNYMCVAKKN